MEINRKTAYNTLLEVEKSKAFSNLELNHQIAENEPDSPAFVRELVYGVLENQIYIDYILNQLIPKGLKGVKKQPLVLLRMGLYQLMFMDSVPNYAAVHETVRIAKRVIPGRDGFVNGVLRGYEKKRDQITFPDEEKEPEKYLSVRYSCDPWIVRLWNRQYGMETAKKLLEAGTQKPELSIRVNLLKGSREALKETLSTAGFDVREASLSDRVLFVKGSGLLDTAEFAEGLFSVQDEASVLAAEALAPRPGDTVLDICAAPGGKTLAIAEIMENQGKIRAFDVYAHKLEILSAASERLGLTIIEPAENDGTVLNEALIDTADKVLVDGPCSGLGVIRRKPEIKYKKLEDEGRELAVKQFTILENSSKYVKVGGTLLYSTCTINQIENEEVVRKFLDAHPEFEKISEKQFMPGVDETDGFFICKMIRRA